MIKIIYVAFLILILTLNIEAMARDLGKSGATYEIAEEGFVSMMKNRLAGIDIEKYQEEMSLIVRKKVLEPEAVLGIRATSSPREFFYDPSFIVSEDIKLPGGEILHKAGTRVNPLDHMDFDRELIFIDGRSKEQIEWLREEIRRNKNENLERRIILVGGKILELQEELGKTLYFDQAGELTSKFGIKQVPALVVQDGKKLKIQEILID